MFVQSIYESRITGSFGPLALLSLQKLAMTRNCKADVTSFLYHDKILIFQVVEGKPGNVAEIMDWIGKSRKHKDVKVRAILRCNRRSFPHWYFGATNCDDHHFKRVYGALNKPAFFNLDVVEAVQILQMVASRKRRAVKMDQFSAKTRNFKSNKEPRPLQAIR